MTETTDSAGGTPPFGLTMGEGVWRPEVTGREVEISPHTGRSLRRLDVEGRIAGADVQVVTDALHAGRDSGLTDTEGNRWRVSNWSESHTSGAGNPYEFWVHLEELETLSADRVVMDGLVVTPTFYEERYEQDPGAIVVTLRACFTEEEAARLRVMHESRRRDDGSIRYFPVVREGVEDRELSMRLGRILWQATSEGVNAQVTLVEENYDSVKENLRPGLTCEPELGHALRWAAQAGERLEALLRELQDAGVLTAEATGRVRVAGDRRRSWDAVEVENLDEWD